MSPSNNSNTIRKLPVDPSRIRERPRQFACVDRALVYKKHICRMRLAEIALYVFLECVSDPQGLSYYSDKRICQYLQLSPDQLHQAREALIRKQIILYVRPIYQVLDLPAFTHSSATPSIPAPRSALKPTSENHVAISTVIESLRKGLNNDNA